MVMGICSELRAGGRDKEKTQSGCYRSLPQDNVLSPLASVCKEQQKPEGAPESAESQGRLPERVTF